MKKQYEKPGVYLKQLTGIKAISSLTSWLEQNELTGAGITTYLIQS